MDASDQAAILKLMDEEDGVVNRRVRKKSVHQVKGSGTDTGAGASTGAAASAVIGRDNTTVRFRKPVFEGESVEETDNWQRFYFFLLPLLCV